MWKKFSASMFLKGSKNIFFKKELAHLGGCGVTLVFRASNPIKSLSIASNPVATSSRHPYKDDIPIKYVKP